MSSWDYYNLNMIESEFKSWSRILSPVQDNEESGSGIMLLASPAEESALATNVMMIREILKFETTVIAIEVASYDKEKLFCDCCHKTSHTWERCPKFHGHLAR